MADPTAIEEFFDDINDFAKLIRWARALEVGTDELFFPNEIGKLKDMCIEAMEKQLNG